MKIILIFVVLFALSCSKDNFTEFNKCIQKSDLKNAEKILNNWDGDKLKDPQYYICQFNFYVNKGRTTGIEIQNEPPNEEKTIQITDPKTGEVKGYFGPSVHYDEDIVLKGIKYIKKGIKLFPDHFEMRFGLMWCYKELYQLDNYLSELESSIIYLQKTNNTKIYWNNNELIENPSEFIIENIQDNFNDLLQDSTIASVKEFVHSYCDLMIKYFPKHKYGFSNKAVLYYYSKKDKEALNYFLKAYELDKTDELIIFNIAVFYKTLGEKDKATEFFNVLVKNGKDPYYVDGAKQKLKELK
ncbi:hypothetical protein ES703_26931 [subsurface metagenome]